MVNKELKYREDLDYCIYDYCFVLSGSFQLIPIPGNANNHTVYQSATSQVNSQSAFRAPAESSKVKCEKVDDDRSGTPSPSVALTPLSTNMAQNSNKAKPCKLLVNLINH